MLGILILELLIFPEQVLTLKKGDSCTEVNAPCTDDYKLICNAQRQCDCRSGTMLFNGVCVAAQLYFTCDEGITPPCSQFPKAQCVLGKCDCANPYLYHTKANPNACFADLAAGRGQTTTCKTDANCDTATLHTGSKCIDLFCQCPPGTMVDRISFSFCNPVMKMDCTSMGIYENCKLVSHASCKIPPGMSSPICSCDAGYTPKGNLCVQGTAVIPTVNDAKIDDPCVNPGSACNTPMTLFCTGADPNSKCGCRTYEVDKGDGKSCTRDPNAPADNCPDKQVLIAGNCTAVVNAPCSVAGVKEKCDKIANATCAAPEGSASLVCMCPKDMKPAETGDACLTQAAAAVAEATAAAAVKSGNSTSNATKSGSGNVGIIIGVVVGLLLLLVAAAVVYWYVKKRKGATDEEGEEEAGEEGEGDPTGAEEEE